MNDRDLRLLQLLYHTATMADDVRQDLGNLIRRYETRPRPTTPRTPYPPN